MSMSFVTLGHVPREEGRLTNSAMVVHASLMLVGTALFANAFILG